MKECVIGNIGSGKTTYIENFIKEHPDYEVMPEELDLWEPYFKPQYEAINSPLPLTLE